MVSVKFEDILTTSTLPTSPPLIEQHSTPSVHHHWVGKMARRDLVKVLTLIDESLSDLKGTGGAQKQQQISSLSSSNLPTAYLNTLTSDLLEQQKQNATLLEENDLLRRRLNMQSNTNTHAHSPTTSRSSSKHHLPPPSYVDSRSTTISECIAAINSKVDEQADLLQRKQIDGMCSIAHIDVQTSLDRCLSQLQRFREGELIAKQQRSQLFISAERDRDKLAAAMLEIQHLQGERRRMEARLEAFELENMRLTNDLSRERDRTTGANEYVNHSKSEIVQANEQNQLLLKEIETLKNQNYRLVNEIDERMNLQQGQ